MVVTTFNHHRDACHWPKPQMATLHKLYELLILNAQFFSILGQNAPLKWSMQSVKHNGKVRRGQPSGRPKLS